MKFIKKKTFYPFPVYEFNLPAGHTCPQARDCKVMVDRKTGKFNIIGNKFRCYAAVSERFPAVRSMRWSNYESVMNGEKIEIPFGASHVRIHGSGDFFSQDYFDSWLDVIYANSDVKFWAFTKSISYWINRINDIPSNFTLQASKGSYQDNLIDEYGLKYAQVFTDLDSANESGLPIDSDDSHAMSGTLSFALLDNFKYSKKEWTRKNA